MITNERMYEDRPGGESLNDHASHESRVLSVRLVIRDHSCSFALGLIPRSSLQLDLHRSGERTRLACCSRRPAGSGSDGSGETPKPTRGTRVLPGPQVSVSAMPRGMPRGCLLVVKNLLP